MFRLFMGSMNSALKVSDQPEDELEQLKLRAQYFYSKVSFMVNTYPSFFKIISNCFMGWFYSIYK